MITLEKAEENLEDFVHGDFRGSIGELNESAMLGVEAMKRVAYHRNYLLKQYIDDLPGETKE